MENGLLRWVGLGLFCLVLLLSPIIGGIPPGSAYQSDVVLNGLRFLALGAGLLLTVLPPSDTTPAKTPLLSRTALALVLATIALTIVSFLVKSRFLTSPVLLFALVPGVLDWVVYAMLFTLTLRLARDPQARTAVLIAVLSGAVLCAIKSVLDTIAAGDASYRAQGFFFSPNFAAGLFALCLPLIVACCLATKEKPVAAFSGIGAALMGGALVASGSRAGIALTLVGLAVAFLLSGIAGQLRRLPWRRVGVLIIGLLVAGFLMRGAITARAAAGGQEQSGDFRKWTWRGTVNMAKANPLLGTGPGTYPYLYPKYALVEKTDLAHSSYLQVASEQGFPALLTTVGALAATLLAGIAALWQARKTTPSTPGPDTVPFLLCGLTGGLLASLGRSVFDSEWSLLGDGIPFWTVAGLLAGLAATYMPAVTPSPAAPSRVSPGKIASAVGLAVALVLALLCLRTTQERDSAQQARLTRTALAPPTSFGWPPDPDLAVLGGRYDLAAEWEPSGKRLYQWGRFQERQGDLLKAIDNLRRATEADPNNLQSWNQLAKMLQTAGRDAEALQAYNELVVRHEGPAGQVRALPEVTETYPAFAYFALGQSEATRRPDAARDDYAKAASVIERYANTPPLYQQIELATATQSGVDLGERRRELVDLYRSIMEARVKLDPAQKAALAAERDSTLSLLEKMQTQVPSSNDTISSGAAVP